MFHSKTAWSRPCLERPTTTIVPCGHGIRPAYWLSVLLAMFMVLPAVAGTAGKKPDSGEQVYRYFSSLDTFHARFTQQVEDSDGHPVQASEGEVWIKRPGRFRWNYKAPYTQEVVANGVELWTYDPELEQATVKPIDQVLSVTPAMLLSGVRDLHEIATIRPLGVYQEKHWYQVLPLQDEDTVDQVQLAFNDRQLSAIRVSDSFGNTTTIEFSAQQKNAVVAEHLFSIELPAGTDILGAE